MEFIRTFRDRMQTRREDDLHRQAEDLITLSTFDSSLYIAFQGTPLVPIGEDLTTKDIVEELTKVRQNYVNAKMKQLC